MGTEKENTSDNVKPSSTVEDNAKVELKGFQLWLAENKDDLKTENNADDVELQSIGLKKWKELSKDEKDQYKSPRVPGAKRKRSDNASETEPEPKKQSFT